MNMSTSDARKRNAEASHSEEQATPDWQVGIVADTVLGEVVLKMTEDQAEALRDGLTFLMGDTL